MAKRQLAGAALTANVIKKRLKALYPNVKFSAKSDVFSMGDSVDIRWTDGPLQETIEAITNKYQSGSFNSMAEMYEYENIDPSLGCDGAKYVQCHRTISSEFMEKLVAKAEEQFGKLDPRDYSYYRRLIDIEKEFFPYPEAPQKPTVTTNKGGVISAGLEITIIKDVDTRDNSEIYVVKVKTKVDDFQSLRQEMSSLGGYYSRFKRGIYLQGKPHRKIQQQTKRSEQYCRCGR